MTPYITREEFLIRAIAKHGEVYDYSRVRYNTYSQKVIIVCKKHGDFLQKPSAHVDGNGCPACGNERRSEKRKRESRPSLLKSKEICNV